MIYSPAKTTLDNLANFMAHESFVPEYRVPETLQDRREEGLGIAISQWTDCDGLAIMRIFRAALEDANFHDAAAEVNAMIAKEMAQ